ncbi:MAG: hypothetical protein O3B41_01325 [Bacteroidetes bacterium]|nr:hypothetical protein [Bacteroidota bacterium]
MNQKRIDSHFRLKGIGLASSLFLLCLGLVGCDASAATDLSDPVDSLTSTNLIESMVMTPIPSRDGSLEQEYVLEVTMKSTTEVSYPEVINLLGATEKMPASLIYDDGSGYDKTPGDLVFTGVVTEACAPFDLPKGVAAKDIFFVKVTCSGDFIRPGEECEGYGICPEQTSRSFLWGLIEYDTSVALCWCGFECSYELGLKFGK